MPTIEPFFAVDTAKLFKGDCIEVMRQMPRMSVDAIVTDPPYGLEFMGREWDKLGATVETDSTETDSFAASMQEWHRQWAVEAMRVLKPGGYLLAFGGSRTFHRMACAIEDAGFEMRDTVMYLYGCLSDDTEILIDGRWEPYHKAVSGRLAMCYDAATDEFSWQPIQDHYVYDYDDTAYRIQSDCTDQIVSRNHRCLVEQGGTYEFVVAEEAAREREARVPVLEGVQALLGDLPMPYERAGGQEQVLFADVRECAPCGDSHWETAWPSSETSQEKVSSLSPSRRSSGEPDQGEQVNLLQSFVSSEGARETSAAVLQQRKRQDSTGNRIGGLGESGVERRRDVFQDEGKLQGCPVCSVPAGISSDGVEPRPQVVRASRYTTADLARITPIHYRGIVWCVRVPTGAFVARRNGKVFVTGNSGFPKSLDVSKAIDKEAGAVRAVRAVRAGDDTTYGLGHSGNVTEDLAVTELAKKWQGFGTALKPAFEPIVLARKPLSESTVAANVLKWGTGALNIDGCRIEGEKAGGSGQPSLQFDGENHRPFHDNPQPREFDTSNGRWPANVAHDGSPQVLDEFAKSGESKSQRAVLTSKPGNIYGGGAGIPSHTGIYGFDDSGTAARFFYCAKSSREDRNVANKHPTVKPLALMQYLCKLVVPPGGIVLDPFAGSGTTLVAAMHLGFKSLGIEREDEYLEIIKKRLTIHAARKKKAKA